MSDPTDLDRVLGSRDTTADGPVEYTATVGFELPGGVLVG